MNFINRIRKNIKRQYWRSILIVSILSIVVIVSLISRSISSSAANNIKEIQKALGNKVTLSSSNKSEMPTQITNEILEKLKNSSYVEDYDYVINDWIEARIPSLKNEQSDLGMAVPSNKGTSTKKMNKKDNIFLFGNTKPQSLDDIVEKRIAITEGRFYTEEDIKDGKAVVVINKRLAEDNNLHLNDTFKIKKNDKEGKETEIPVTIIGIYQEAKKPENIHANGYPYLLAPATFIEKLNADSNKTVDEAYFFLKDPTQREAFVEDAYKSLDKDKFTIDSENQMYKKLSTPFETMKSFSNITQNAILGAGAIIMFFILFIITKERRYEIGILRALGIKKSKIISQLVCETFILAVVALFIGSIIGSMTSSSITSSVMQESTKTGSAVMNGISLQSSIQTTVSLDVVDYAYIVIIMLIIVFIASLASVFIITKNEPMDILRNSN